MRRGLGGTDGIDVHDTVVGGSYPTILDSAVIFVVRPPTRISPSALERRTDAQWPVIEAAHRVDLSAAGEASVAGEVADDGEYRVRRGIDVRLFAVPETEHDDLPWPCPAAKS